MRIFSGLIVFKNVDLTERYIKDCQRTVKMARRGIHAGEFEF